MRGIVSVLLMCWVWYHRASNSLTDACSEHIERVLPGDVVSLECPGRSMAPLTRVTWYISRFDPAGLLIAGNRESLPIEGNLFQGTSNGIARMLDLTIRNVSERFEGRYSCMRHFEENENDDAEPIDVGCVFVIRKAVLKCSGGTDCSRSGVAVPAQPGNVDCGLNRSATEGGDVVLDSSVLFASGGHERQVVNAVYIDGPSGGLKITCTINGTIGSCNGDVGIRIVEDSIEEGGALNISLTLQDVTLEHSGGYTVRVVASTLTKMSRINEQCLRYHLTVDEERTIRSTEAITDWLTETAHERATTPQVFAEDAMVLKLVGRAVCGAVGGVLFLLVVIGGCWVVVQWSRGFHKPSTPIILGEGGVGGEEGATHIPSVSLHIEESVHPMSSPELEGGGSEGSDLHIEESVHTMSSSELEGGGSEGSDLHIEESVHTMSSSELEGGGSEGSDSLFTAVSDLRTRDSWAGSPIEEVELGYRILNSHSHNV